MIPSNFYLGFCELINLLYRLISFTYLIAYFKNYKFLNDYDKGLFGFYDLMMFINCERLDKFNYKNLTYTYFSKNYLICAILFYGLLCDITIIYPYIRHTLSIYLTKLFN